MGEKQTDALIIKQVPTGGDFKRKKGQHFASYNRYHGTGKKKNLWNEIPERGKTRKFLQGGRRPSSGPQPLR